MRSAGPGTAGPTTRAGLAAGLLVVAVTAACTSGHLPASSPARAEFVADDGARYAVVGEWLYREDGSDLVPVAELYDPVEVSAAFVEREGRTFRRSGDQLLPVVEDLAVDFDGADTLGDVVFADAASPFHGIVLREPSAPAADDHYWGSRCVLEGRCRSEGGFDVGGGVVSFVAAPVGDIGVAKASLEQRLLHLAAGDEVRVKARFRFHEPLPYSVLDLESSFLLDHPGIRLILDDGALAVELKWGSKPVWRQPRPVPVPLDTWVEIEWRMVLDAGSTGIVELRQDGSRVLSATSQTLPLDDTVYDILEVGVTAHTRQREVRVDLDELRVSGS